MSATVPRYGLVLAALITVQVLFGINYVVSKIVVDIFPPMVWASIRIIISSGVMVAYCLATRRPHPKPERSFFGPLIIFALLGAVINQSAFLVGLSYTTSTNSAILNTLIPVFTLLVVTLRGQEAATPKRIVGFLTALLGVLVLRNVEHLSLSDKTVVGDLLMILNCFSYALCLAYSKSFFERYDPIWTTAWLFIYGSVGITLLAIPQYMTFEWPQMTPSIWAAAFFAVIGATLMTYFLNFWALRYARSSQVALFIYIQPIITSFIAWTWMGEEVTIRSVLATGFIFIGMLLGLSQRTSQKKILTAVPLQSTSKP